MSEYEYEDDYDEPDHSGGGLRAQLEQVLKDNRALKAETATLKSQIAQSKATETLIAKGYSPAVARLAIKDGVDMSNEKALENWLAENGDLFVKPGAPQPEANPLGEPQVDDPDPEMVQAVESAYGAMSRIHSTASPETANKFAATMAALPDDASQEQVLAAFRAAGL